MAVTTASLKEHRHHSVPTTALSGKPAQWPGVAGSSRVWTFIQGSVRPLPTSNITLKSKSRPYNVSKVSKGRLLKTQTKPNNPFLEVRVRLVLQKCIWTRKVWACRTQRGWISAAPSSAPLGFLHCFVTRATVGRTRQTVVKGWERSFFLKWTF